MLSLPQKLVNYLRKAHVKLAALVGIVTSVLSDEQHSRNDWLQGMVEGTFPQTTVAATFAIGATTLTVTSTSGFSVGSAACPQYLLLTDGSNFEIMTYTGSTGTTFTGIARGLEGTSQLQWGVGSAVWQIVTFPGGPPDYSLEIRRKNWTQPSAFNNPPQRAGAKMVYNPANGCFYMFGGYDGANYKNDIWLFNPAANIWIDLNATGTLPAARAYHCMGCYSGVIWIYGGHNGSNTFKDVWAYTPGLNTWYTAPSWDRNTWPLVGDEYVHSAMSVVCGLGFFIFGGESVSGGVGISGTLTGACAYFNFTTGLWHSFAYMTPLAYGDAVYQSETGCFFVVGSTGAIGSQGTLTAARLYNPVLNVWWNQVSFPPGLWQYPTLVDDPINKVVLMFGGEYQHLGYNSLYSYKYNSGVAGGSWTALDSFNREGRSRHCAAWDWLNQEMVIWGGWTNSNPPVAPSYPDPARFRYYWPEARWYTSVMDVGDVPSEHGFWILDDSYDVATMNTGVTYTADYSDDGANWTGIGAVTDGADITELHRYWRVHATLTNRGLNNTPAVRRIDACFDRMEYFSLASRPVGDYLPIVHSVSSLTSEIDPVKNTANMGGISVCLLNSSRIAQGLLTRYFMRDKTVKLKLGVLEDDYSEKDFALVLKGKVENWDFDGNVIKFDVTDFLGKLQKDIPEEAGNPPSITPLVYNDLGIASHPVDIILDILQNRLEVADRDIDINSFMAVKAEPSLAGWKFNRALSSPEDAYELCIDICRHIGAALIPRENGKVALKMLKTSDQPAAEWNERDQGFRNARFNGRGDTIRNFVSTWWGWNGEGDDYNNFGGVECAADADSITRWGQKILRTKSKWLGGDVYPYYGKTLAGNISSRIMDLSKNGVQSIELETNMSAYPVQVGDIVRIRPYALSSIEEYRAWQRAFDPRRSLSFVEDTGRLSVPYAVYGAGECVDMKWWATRKQVDFMKGTIKWELHRAREVPLSKTFDSQEDFLSGYRGEQIDLDTAPGYVQLAVESGSDYFASGVYTLVIDLSQQPEQDGEWAMDTTIPNDTDVIFEAWASELGLFRGEQLPLGTVADGDPVAIKTRFYKIVANLTSNPGRSETPQIDKIGIEFSNG